MLLLLFGCPKKAPPLPPAPAFVGACADAEGTPRQQVVQLGTIELVELTCETFAYQSRLEYWTADGTRKVSDFDVLGLPVAEDDTLIWLEKARGPGDCGAWHRARWQDDRLQIVERRERGCDASTDVPSPDEWPLTHLRAAVTDLQNGDAACYVVLADGRSFHGAFELCGPPPTGLVDLVFEAQTVLAASCEGDPECPDSEVVPFVTELRP